MRISTTAILGLIVIILAMVTGFVDRKSETGRRAASLANVLVRIDSELVDGIVIERGVAKTVLAKRDEAWFFSEPEEDRVDAGVIVALLDKINHLAVVDMIGEGESGMSAEQLGVSGNEAVKVTFSGSGSGSGGGERSRAFREVVIFGGDAPRADSIYAKREGGEGGIFVVSGNPRPWLEKPLESLRDSRILGAPVDSIVELVIRQAAGDFALQRRITPPRQEWALVDPIRTWANREVVDQLLTSVGALRIEEVVADAEGGEPIPSPLPAGAAVLQMRVNGIEQALTVYLKQVKGGEEGPPLLEARVSDRPAVYRLRSGILSSLPGSANDLRDRTLARIPGEYLDSIWIQHPIDPRVILKAERRGGEVMWKVSVNNKLVPANAGAVAGLIQAVNDAAIQDFTSDTGENLAEYGLNPPARQVAFVLKFPGPPLEDGSPGQVQEVTQVLNLGWKEGDERRLYANFQGEPYIYELDPSFVSHIPTHPIKWRSLSVLTFNPMHLRSITREMPKEENLKLDYVYRRDHWEASRSGVDVSPSLDKAAARRLSERLGSLTASGWYLSLGQAYEALQNPTVQFSILTTELDPAINEPKEVTYQIKLAPSTATEIYFGQIEGSPDVFLLDHETYQDLRRPVTSSRTMNQ